jgi:hypothetical protein
MLVCLNPAVEISRSTNSLSNRPQQWNNSNLQGTKNNSPAHRLDNKILSMEEARGTDRFIVLDKMGQSDSILTTILSLARAWDCNEAWYTKKDWDKLENNSGEI